MFIITCNRDCNTRSACWWVCGKLKVINTRVLIWKFVYFQTAVRIIRVTVFSDSPSFLFIPLSSFIISNPRIFICAGQDHWCPFKATDSCGGVGHTPSTLNTWNTVTLKDQFGWKIEMQTALRRVYSSHWSSIVIIISEGRVWGVWECQINMLK